MKKIAVLIIISFIFLSCTRTITESCDDYSWQLHEDFVSLERIILNAHTIQENDFLLVNQFEFRKMNTANYAIWCYYHVFCPLFLTTKPIISENYTFYLSPDNDKISIRSNAEPYGFRIWFSEELHDYLHVAELDSTFGENSSVPIRNYQSEFCVCNDENQMLTVIEDPNTINGVYLCFINFHEENNQIIIDNIQTEFVLDWFQMLDEFEYFNGYYFVSLVWNDFSVDSDGIINFIPFDVGSYFKYDDKLWMIAGEYRDNLRLYYTNDGVDWQPSLFINRCINFLEIENKLIGFREDNIFEVDLENAVVYYLDNTGLINNEITSINLFNDYIYVSSLNGLYYRDYSDFFEGKSTEPHDSNSMELIISGDE
jgi:hypothetical protein